MLLSRTVVSVSFSLHLNISRGLQRRLNVHPLRFQINPGALWWRPDADIALESQGSPGGSLFVPGFPFNLRIPGLGPGCECFTLAGSSPHPQAERAENAALSCRLLIPQAENSRTKRRRRIKKINQVDAWPRGKQGGARSGGGWNDRRAQVLPRAEFYAPGPAAAVLALV